MSQKITPYDAGYVKRFWPALLLCLFFGILGAHRFYTGYYNIGIVFLLCALTGVGTVVTGIWALYDLAMIILKRYKTPNGRALE